ncbi:aminopeptidase P family protein [Anaerolineales bacterium HSG6]|nr:aminopeptidase P family protein [Anaerolineales bacterium HSG6]MDM8530110.1 aminopeptidase P family protein [Anaerolineales bacterium HSG25]
MSIRLEAIRVMMDDAQLAGVMITEPYNRRYLSGFTGSNGVLIITADKQIIATDSRYYEQVSQETPTWELAEVGYDFSAKMLELLRGAELGGRAVGFESQVVSVATLHSWERAIKGQLMLVHTEGLVETVRMQKDTNEVEAMRKAIALADETMAYIFEYIQPGQTEVEVAWEIERYMRTHGASATSFDPIVASGANSGKPHATPSNRVLQIGEPIMIDFGCIIDGYCSDITRTICLGKPADDQYLKIWNIVRDAHDQAIKATKADLTGEEIDKVARDIIEQAGFKDNFGHSLGHGVGLAIHELPRFSFNYPEEIPTGSVVTVEPGIYIPDWGGIRLEDIVLVHDNRAEVLSQAPLEPFIDR